MQIFLAFYLRLILYVQGNAAEKKLKTQQITRTKDNQFKIETEENSSSENNTSEENDANVQYDDNDENDEENMKHPKGINKTLF